MAEEPKNPLSQKDPTTAAAADVGVEFVLSPKPQDDVVEDTSKKTSSQIDLKDILLPRNVPSTISTERASAADVLSAANVVPQPPLPASSDHVHEPDTIKEKPIIAPIHTYTGDIAETVRGQNVSLMSIAAAEARRQGNAQTSAEFYTGERERRSYVISGIIILFITLGVAGFAWYAVGERILVTSPVPLSPFIRVDNAQLVTADDGIARDMLLQGLTEHRDAVALALGLVSRVFVAHNATSTPAYTAQEFFVALDTDAPSSLIRALSPEFLLGVHVFDGNQPFLMFRTDNYNQTYAGMIEWEPSMQHDLYPLFNRTPHLRIPGEGTTTISSFAPKLIKTPFIDMVTENHDARVVHNAAGDILLLWTFLDRNTLVITTNEYTLREIISRLTEASIIPIK